VTVDAFQSSPSVHSRSLATSASVRQLSTT
jgi:hypothetical protein